MIAAGLPWPTWQQAWFTSLVLVVAFLALRSSAVAHRAAAGDDDTHPLRPDVLLPVLQELIVLTGLYGLWQSAKKLPLNQSEGAIERAERIIEVQDAIGIPSELRVQEIAIDHGWLGWSSVAYYAAVHVPATIAFLIWMFWRHRDRYDRWRNLLSLTTAGCLVIRFWKVAPPRFLTEAGFQDLSDIHGMSVYGPVGTGLSGQFVAMPSIHVAWAGVVGIGVLVASSSPWRWLVALHFPVTVFVVSATGHHWWLDGIVAMGLFVLAIPIERAARRAYERIKSRRSTAPDEASEHRPLEGAGSGQAVPRGGSPAAR